MRALCLSVAAVLLVAAATPLCADQEGAAPTGPMPKGTILGELGFTLGGADVSTTSGTMSLDYWQMNMAIGRIFSDAGVGAGLRADIGGLMDGGEDLNSRFDGEAWVLAGWRFPTEVVAKAGYAWTDLDGWGYHGPLLGLAVRQPVAKDFGLYGSLRWFPSLSGTGEVSGMGDDGHKWEVGVSYRGLVLGYRSERFNASDSSGLPMGDAFDGVFLGWTLTKSPSDDDLSGTGCLP
jgi:hypothetical protein